MATITVGSGKDYATITLALAAAGASDIIDVYEGTYNEDVDFTAAGQTIQKHSGESVTWNLNGAGNGVHDAGFANCTCKDFDDIHVTANKGDNYVLTGDGVGALFQNLHIDTGAYSCRGGYVLYDGGTFDRVVLTGTAGSIGLLPYSVGASTLYVKRCKVTGFQIGYYIGGDSASGIKYLYNNISDSPSENGIYWSGATLGTIYCYNNTVYSAGTHSFQIADNAGTIYFKNNISDSPANYHLYFGDKIGTFDSDYNVGYNAGTNWAYAPPVGAYNFAGWQTLNSSDANSYSTDPGLTNPATGDFTLDGTGSADDAGVDLSGVFTDDYAGTTRTGDWDIGAYNYAGAPPAGPSIVGWKTLLGVGQAIFLYFLGRLTK